VIDLLNENLLTLAQAAKCLPGRPHLSTLARWARGMKDGRRLATVKIGGRVYTSTESLARFAAAANNLMANVTLEISKSHQAKLEQLDRELDAEGL
jgi:hypothetical protein